MISGSEVEIRRRISQRGRITFREFMELALYWPEGGYYTTTHTRDPAADFYTSPSTHPTFGALICMQLYQMWNVLRNPTPFWVIESGSGPGLLCHSVVSFSSKMPSNFSQALQYVCLDRRSHGNQDLENAIFRRGQVERLIASGMPLKGLVGCVLSNELVDSFPVHKVTVRNGQLMEVFVELQEGKLVESLDSPSTVELQRRLKRVGAFLMEGAYAEINLHIDTWIREAAKGLERGYLMSIDYGFEASELYSQQRQRGTITTFHQHVQTDNPYIHVGNQDITAQVDFTALQLAGNDNGMQTVGDISQRKFLLNLGLREWIGRLAGERMPQWEADPNRMGMQELIRPGGMGDFKVFIQSKKVETSTLWGTLQSDEAKNLLQHVPLPKLTRRYTPIFQARYPHASFDWEHLWHSDSDSLPT
jgi:SAM-dependent MidA family methyltransferase